MTDFFEKLNQEIKNSLGNNYTDNYDETRFGKNNISFFKKLRWEVRKFIFPNLVNKHEVASIIKNSTEISNLYGNKLKKVYEILSDDESKDWLVKLTAFYILGHLKVKLPSHNSEYFNWRNNEDKLFDKNKSINVNFLGEMKPIFFADLTPIGFPLKLYTSSIVHQFQSQQYNYKNLIKTEPGDVVFDCGVCYGDTALYFSYLVGEKGKVIGYEFIPSNLEAISKNLELNHKFQGNITIIKQPVWNEAKIKTFYKDLGPGSKVSFENFKDSEGDCETTTIDETVQRLNLKNVNFIKMDIEGAEMFALEGAKETILTYKPKLAIASYHSFDDFVNIPLWIESLNLGYKIYIGHPTIHWEETIIFAEIR